MRNFLNINAFVQCAKQLEEGQTGIGIHVLPLKEGADESGNTHVLRHVYFKKDVDKCIRPKTAFLGRIRIKQDQGFAKRYSGWLNYERVVQAHNECLKNFKQLQVLIFHSDVEDEYYLSVPTSDTTWVTIASLKSIDKFAKKTSNSSKYQSEKTVDELKYMPF